MNNSIAVFRDFMEYVEDKIEFYEKETEHYNQRLQFITELIKRDEEYYISNFLISFKNIENRKILYVSRRAYLGKDKFKVSNVKIYNNLVKHYNYNSKQLERFRKVSTYPCSSFLMVYRFIIREIERVILETGTYKAGSGMGTLKLALLDYKPNYDYRILQKERRRVIDAHITHYFYLIFRVNRKKKNITNYNFHVVSQTKYSIYGKCHIPNCNSIPLKRRKKYLFDNEKDCLDNDYVGLETKVKFLMSRDMWYFKNYTKIKKEK
jgi:hypothetical protein